MTKKTTKRGKKTAKKASAKTTNGSRSRIDPTAKLTLVKNPFREGSVRYKWAELAGRSKTAAEYLSKKGAGNYLSWLVRHGHVKVGS